MRKVAAPSSPPRLAITDWYGRLDSWKWAFNNRLDIMNNLNNLSLLSVKII